MSDLDLPNDPADEYWCVVRRVALALWTDHCSHVPDFYRDCCDEHDIHYRTHATLYGDPLTRVQADARFRACIQARSAFGRGSPMSWWRWGILRAVGWRAWKKGGRHGTAA